MGNKYTTTIWAINSAVVKLGKLTFASKVYRGVHDFVLPDQFWMQNSHGVRGGIEGAFMSTTLDRETALRYAASSGGAGFVFEIQQGMIDRGVCTAVIVGAQSKTSSAGNYRQRGGRRI